MAPMLFGSDRSDCGSGRAHEDVFERLNRLQLAVFEDLEVFGAQIQHGLSGLGRIHVDAHEVGLGAERWRLLRVLGGLAVPPDWAAAVTAAARASASGAKNRRCTGTVLSGMRGLAGQTSLRYFSEPG